jgi:hypothetical protein
MQSLTKEQAGQSFSLKLKILEVLNFSSRGGSPSEEGGRLRRRLVVLTFSSRGGSSLGGDFDF